MLDPPVRWRGGGPETTGACHNSEKVLEPMKRATGWWQGTERVEASRTGNKVVLVLRRLAAARRAVGLEG